MTRAVHAEWTKLRSVSSSAWSLLSIVVCTVATGTFATMGLRAEDGVGADTARISLSGVYLGQVGVVVLAVLAVAPEYESAMIRTTLAADPRRWRVFGAKAGVVTVIVLATGAVTVLGSLVSARIMLPRSGFPTVSLVDGATLRAHGGTVLYLGLVALLGIGVALIVRHTGGAITAVLSLLYTFPIIAALVTDPDWRKWLLRLAPMTAGLAIQTTRDLDAQPIAPWTGLAVLAGYAAAAVTLGAVLFQRRDA